MKNDGFDHTTGTYYQIFSPEDITKDTTIREAVKKLKTEVLHDQWTLHSNKILKYLKFIEAKEVR